MSEHDKAQTFRDLHIRLIEILEVENEDLRQYSTDKIRQNLDEKTKVCQLYERQMKIIKANPDILKSLDEDEMAELKELATQLDELINENEKALKIAINTSRRVFSHVSNAASDMSKTKGIYSDSGQMGSTTQEPIRPVAMNDTI